MCLPHKNVGLGGPVQPGLCWQLSGGCPAPRGMPTGTTSSALHPSGCQNPAQVPARSLPAPRGGLCCCCCARLAAPGHRGGGRVAHLAVPKSHCPALLKSPCSVTASHFTWEMLLSNEPQGCAAGGTRCSPQGEQVLGRC